ncbi:INO80 complex subunit C isoform X1 [Zootoca vivipara]|uniref:INO80 complex subunit C isoform X1 n=1 Tax=Zootoca vivipara TaxID=8524 RepID=UPI00293BE46D|nr:INO80 complex subunit C isoform X1 [Zootoca vivipara]
MRQRRTAQRSGERKLILRRRSPQWRLRRPLPLPPRRPPRRPLRPLRPLLLGQGQEPPHRAARSAPPALGTAAPNTSAETAAENKTVTTDPSTGPVETSIKPLPFKSPSFVHSGIGGAAAGKKNRTWKNLKQILASERALPWQLNDPSYFSIDAPPSFKPAKKYSDISGLPASYTDPQSKLRFSTIEEFAYIRMLPSDVVTGYLTLRKASTVVP